MGVPGSRISSFRLEPLPQEKFKDEPQSLEADLPLYGAKQKKCSLYAIKHKID